MATIPITYSNATIPDSLHLSFTSSAANRPTVGTVLFVDDITIGTAITATRDAALAAALTVWPNPSSDGRFTLQTTDPALLAAPLLVQDATGRVVYRDETPKPAAARTLDLSSLARGLYTLQLFTAKGLVTKKLSLR
ncbi:T9SS type A sorting domain-containing protein [Hymenobacter humi]|uniref:T9SS type A sorting domain-containing protein n=1 Tax=Hymenobacter humi TaxID=1411620 RepID=A0ABW2U5A9_9BACT